MRWTPWGDAGVLLEDLEASPADWYRTLTVLRLPHVRAIVPALDSVWLEVAPGFDPSRLPDCADPSPPVERRVHELPARWSGADLDLVARDRDLSPREVIDQMQGTTFEVAAIGFQPGFPYLRGLPTALAGLPRRAAPRTRVPAGSIAIQGELAGVYPRECPGGWNLLGTVLTPICDPDADHFPLSPGDLVRFLPA